MELRFLGGADEVGGSCLLVKIGGHRLAIDCGIRLGSGRNDPLPELSQVHEFGGIEAVIVTHGHTDHVGALPVLCQSQRVPVITADATAQLMRILFGDGLNIMEMQTQWSGQVPLYSASPLAGFGGRFGVSIFRPTIVYSKGEGKKSLTAFFRDKSFVDHNWARCS